MNKYCLGFVFSVDQERVLLLSKRSSDQFNPSLWNGLGGHVEKGETPLQAMVRECMEEASLRVDEHCWEHVGMMSDYDLFHVDVFACVARIDAATQSTDEVIQAFTRDQVKNLPLADGVRETLLPWIEGGEIFQSPC